MADDVMIENPHMKRKIMALALKLLQLERAKYAAHDEERRDWYRSGDGRNGYRFPICIHGSSLITDYDNICGGCEDGYTYFEYERDARESIDRAKRAYTEYLKRYDLVLSIMGMGYDKPTPLAKWADEAIDIRKIR